MTSLTISEVSQISKHLEKMIEIEGEKLNNWLIVQIRLG